MPAEVIVNWYVEGNKIWWWSKTGATRGRDYAKREGWFVGQNMTITNFQVYDNAMWRIIGTKEVIASLSTHTNNPNYPQHRVFNPEQVIEQLNKAIGKYRYGYGYGFLRNPWYEHKSIFLCQF